MNYCKINTWHGRHSKTIGVLLPVGNLGLLCLYVMTWTIVDAPYWFSSLRKSMSCLFLYSGMPLMLSLLRTLWSWKYRDDNRILLPITYVGVSNVRNKISFDMWKFNTLHLFNYNVLWHLFINDLNLNFLWKDTLPLVMVVYYKTHLSIHVYPCALHSICLVLCRSLHFGERGNLTKPSQYLQNQTKLYIGCLAC